MKIETYKYNCQRCGNTHNIPINIDSLSKAQKEGRKPIIDSFICPDMATMYRVGNFNLDTRRGFYDLDIDESMKESSILPLKAQWGELNFDKKFKRYRKIEFSFLGIPEEYFDLLNEIVNSYISGYFYPSITGAGSLGERLLNRLVTRLRTYYKKSKSYEKIKKGKSFTNWPTMIEALSEWHIISDEVAELFKKLKKYRNDSVHYNVGYDFEENSLTAIELITSIIDKQFNYMKRKDLFWVFDIPGEIWVKNSAVEDPFVKEFVLPHCWLLTPYDEPMAKPPVKATNVPTKPLTDEEFIKLRKERKKL